jgi:phage terminase small subunit
VSEGTAKQLQRADLSAARVLEEYRRLAFSDTRSFFDEHGNLKPVQELTAEQGAVLSGIEVIIKNAKAGDGVTDEIHKIKLWDKTKALDSLAKHFGLLKETIDVQGGLELRWQD